VNNITSTAVRSFLLDRYASRLAAKDAAVDSIPDDYDLFQQGVIDSLGILEMVGAVETEFEIELDLGDLDAEDLTKVGPFCRFVEKLSQSSSKPSYAGSSPDGAAASGHE
jgi:acyl carrier protein